MDRRPIRVLLVDDDEDDYVLTRELLAEVEPGAYTLDWAPSFAAGLEAMEHCGHDVYLVDYRLGGRDGLELIREAMGRGCRAPLILLTGQGDRAVDVEAMRSGAADYMSKARMEAAVLDRSIRHALERMKAQDALRQMRDELEVRVRERTAELAQANAALQAEVAERRRIEGQLRQAMEAVEASSRAKDEFLAALSHELRTPLTPVLAAVSALLDDPQTPAEILPTLEMTRRNVTLEARLIDDLLDVTRIIRGKLSLQLERVDAHAILLRSLSICRSELLASGLHLELDLQATAAHVEADPARLQQVFWNLLKNAIKFTPGGGSLTIRSRNAPAPMGGGQVLVIEVSDTGIGIAPEALPRIFNTFEQGGAAITRQFGGLGLGLAISRSVVELHHGTLSASSPGPGRGATFTLGLTTLSETAAALSGPSRPATPTRRALRVLLVEDHADTLQVMSRLLGRLGHAVTTASSVGAALEAARAADFDLLVSDLGLPDGSGLDLMRRLRAAAPRPIPGIALSGYGMEDDLRKSREAGFLAHLTKPVDYAKLDGAIQQAAGGFMSDAGPR
ncbi:MAG TPA: response regulator [Isosphaeraceae bacterium]